MIRRLSEFSFQIPKKLEICNLFEQYEFTRNQTLYLLCIESNLAFIKTWNHAQRYQTRQFFI